MHGLGLTYEQQLFHVLVIALILNTTLSEAIGSLGRRHNSMHACLFSSSLMCNVLDIDVDNGIRINCDLGNCVATPD